MRPLVLIVACALGPGCTCKRTQEPPRPADAEATVDAGPLDAGSAQIEAGPPKEIVAAAFDEAEIVFARADGVLYAVAKEGGEARVVSRAFGRGVRAIAAGHELYVEDDACAVWVQERRADTRRKIGDGSCEGLVATSSGVVFTIGAEGSTPIVEVAADGGGLREIGRVQSPAYQRLVLAVSGGDLFAATAVHPRPYYTSIELVRMNVASGARTTIASTDSGIATATEAGGYVYWYESGFRSSEWGGGYGACAVYARPTRGGRARAIYEIKPEPGRDDCEARVLLAADEAGVSYTRDAEPEIRRQPRGGGRAEVLARASGPIFALAAEGKTVRWLTAAGTAGWGSLR